MIEPASLGIDFGNAPRRRRASSTPAPEPSTFLILHGATLLDAAGEVALWARFTGRDTEEDQDARERTDRPGRSDRATGDASDREAAR